jgi:DnaD/phage-associated family protein
MMSRISIRAPKMNFTPLNNNFIDKYLKDTRGDFLKVYIYCLKTAYSKEDASTEKIGEALNLLESDVLKAFEYWENLGLMNVSPDGVVEIAVTDNSEYNNDVYFDTAVKDMFDYIEKLLGRPLSSKEFHTFMDWMENFKFNPEMVSLLVEYCASKKKYDIRYMEKVALNWHDIGVKTLRDAQTNITKHEEKWNKYRAVLTFMGIKDDISKPQEEFLDKWLIKYGFDAEVINEAVRICISRINESNFSYIDAILNDWNKNNVKTIQDVKKLDKKKPSKKQQSPGNYSGQRQYDINELEKQLLGRGESNEQ